MTKNWKKCTAEEFFLYVFNKKIAIYLSLGFHKGRPSYRRSLQRSNENIQHFKTWNFWNFLFFALLDPDPDPLTWLNPDPIRNTDGCSATIARSRLPYCANKHARHRLPLSWELQNIQYLIFNIVYKFFIYTVGLASRTRFTLDAVYPCNLPLARTLHSWHMMADSWTLNVEFSERSKGRGLLCTGPSGLMCVGPTGRGNSTPGLHTLQYCN